MTVVTDLVRLVFHALFITLAVVGEIPWWVPAALVLNDFRYPVSFNWPPWGRRPAICPDYPHFHGSDGEIIPMIRPEDLVPQLDPMTSIPSRRKPTIH